MTLETLQSFHRRAAQLRADMEIALGHSVQFAPVSELPRPRQFQIALVEMETVELRLQQAVKEGVRA